MNVFTLIRTTLWLIILSTTNAASAADYDPETLTVSAADLLGAETLNHKHYKIADDVLVSGYMNHYTVDSDFGQFTAIGNRKLKELLHEINALVELSKMSSVNVGTDAAVDAVASTGKSLVALAEDPSGTMSNLGDGVSRLFKRTSRAAKKVSAEVAEEVRDEPNHDTEENGDQPSASSQLASSYLGVGAAQRKIASELKVDPYSDNPVLQAELKRVAQISGTVGKVTGMLVPIPSVVGTAASVSDMVWNLSPTDLLIQNQETLKKLGYSDELIQQFFSNEFYSPTEQTAFVAAVKTLNAAIGREILLQNAASVKSVIEAEFMVRSVLFTQHYHERVDPVTEILSSPSGLVPVSITKSGDGTVFAPLDHLLWTQEVEESAGELAGLMDEHGGSDEHLLWVEGNVSELARSKLKSQGWVQSSEAFDRLKEMTN